MDSSNKAGEWFGQGFTRRELFRQGGLLALLMGRWRAPGAVAASTEEHGDNLSYGGTRIGARLERPTRR